MREPIAGSRPGDPTMSAPAFVGRERELAAVLRALDDPPALALIEGEAGIGKTRLVHECLRARGSDSVLVAVCPPLPEPFPLGGLVEALHSVRNQVGEVRLSPLGGALRPLFPEWAADLPPAVEPLDDPAATRHRLLRAIIELFDQLGVAVLVVEDAHWVDAATLELLLMLSASRDPAMSLVVTYRPMDVPEGSLLVRLAAQRPPGMTRVRVELEPFGLDEVRRLVASMFATEEVSEQFAAFLHERTAGIPLVLEETVRLLRDRRDIVGRGGAWSRRPLETLQVPSTVRGSVLERIGRLDPAARRVLEAAAVLAEPADEPLLGRVADLDDTATQRGVADALASGLLQEFTPGRLAARHVLAAKAIEGAISVPERRRFHRRAAVALEAADPPPVIRLSRHFREANDTEAWARYAEASADLALGSGDDRTAVVVLHELLTVAEHPVERRSRLARKVGEAALSGATPLGELTDEVTKALRRALADDSLPAGERGEIRLLLGRMLLGLDENETAYAEIEAALPDLSSRPALAARAMLHLAWPWTGAWPAHWHRVWLDRATALLPHVDSPVVRMSLSIRRMMALLLLGEEAGWQSAAELPQSASTQFERQEIAQAMLNIAQCATVWGRYEEAHRQLAAAADHVQTTGFHRMMDTARTARAHLDWYTGTWDGLAETVAELAESDEVKPGNALEARVIQGSLDLARGARAVAERRLREVSGESARRGRIEPLILPGAALARMSLADGATDDALRATEPDMATIVRKELWVWATDIAPAHLDALVAAGQPDRADALVSAFAEGLGDRHAPAAAAALSTCRAILAEALGALQEAAASFGDAATAWAALPRPYDELLAAERRGGCLLAAGKHEEGLAVLSQAEQRMRRLGARWDADRIAHRLRQHGVDVDRAWRGGRHGYGDRLSPRELEVVRLVATGLNNREVAEILFLSPKTVAHHVSAAIHKLGVGSRTALAISAAEAGLLTDDTDRSQLRLRQKNRATVR